MWDFGDPVASERRFRAASRTATAVQAQVLQTQIARALGLQERYDEAEAVLRGILSEDEEVQVRIALERGRLLRSSGDPATAAPHFQWASDAAEAAGLDVLAVDPLHMGALTRDGEEQVSRFTP